MSTSKKNDSEVAPESPALPGGGRWSSKRKLSVILEILRGADLETTSRKHRVTIATLSEPEAKRLAGDLAAVLAPARSSRSG